MIDPQNNLLTTMLAGLIGLLVLAAGALFVVLGRADLDRIAPVGDTTVARVSVAAPETGLEPFDEYGEIVRRPVFFSDRRLPVVQVAEVDEEVEAVIEEVPEEEPVPDLKAAVAGIIITPDMRMAMIRDEQANRTVLLREGMSLEGDQAAWRLDRIDARLVNFVSVDGRRAGLELEVNTRGLTRPAPPRQASQAELAPEEEAEDNGRPELDDDARSRAEEIRRRVAERRAELRAEAERRAQQQEEQ